LSKTAYFHCPSGISGDMALAALIDAGAPVSELERQLRHLDLPSWDIKLNQAQKNGIACTQISFNLPEEKKHRHLHDMEKIITAAHFAPKIENFALATFRRLAEAEARVHGCGAEEVHFHELGGADTILDIVGFSLAMDLLGIEEVYASSLPLSHGFVDCAHGRMPVPAPAVMELLQGAQVYQSPLEGELITPTGAALLMTAIKGFTLPDFTPEKIGRGGGQKDLPSPNILTVMLGECQTQDSVEVIRTWIDDASPELLGNLWQLAFAAGALDMAYSPIMMKKGRPAWELTVLAKEGQGQKLAQLLFEQTTTIGLRICREQRLVQERQIITVDTIYGAIDIKISGVLGNPNSTIAPEYQSCLDAATRNKVAIKAVYNTAIAAALSLTKNYNC